MPLVDQHPPREELEAFALGRLDDALFDAVESHVAGCSACEKVVSGISGDTFTALLQSARALSDTPRPLAEATYVDPIRGDSGATCSWPTNREEGPPELPAALVNHARYLPVRLLGHGGMGAVWLVEHRVMGRQVAVKVIRPEFMAKQGASERFRREARAAARLRHPNIVAAFDAEQAGETQLLAMEYIEGITLADELRQRGPLPVAEACDVVRQAAGGLQHAFSCGLIHRDLKPHNLMRTADGTVKVLDFGLAVLADTAEHEGGLTGQNVVLGTPDYIAPEQAEDSHTADVRSDIYSLGCTLYHLLTGRVPFPGDSVLRKLDAHRGQEPQPLRTIRPEVPAELAAVAARMMAKQPADRYQTPAEVAAALAPFAAGKVPARGRRRPWVAVAAALLFAGLIAAAGVVFYIKTDNGTIEIRTDDENVKIIAEGNGKQVTVLDPKSKQTWVVDTGEWTVRLDGNPDGLKIEMPKTFTLKRGDKQVVTVKRIKGPDVAVKPPEEEKVGEVRRFQGNPPMERWVTQVRFTRDGRHLVSTAGDIRVWEVSSGKQVRRFAEDLAAWGMALNPAEDHQMFTASDDGNLRQWNWQTGKEEWSIPAEVDRADQVAVSPNGRWILVSGDQSALRVVDARTRKERLSLKGRRVGAFAPDNNHFVAAAATLTDIKLYELESGKEIRTFPGSNTGLTDTFSPDGKYLLTIQADLSIRMYRVADGTEARVFRGYTGRPGRAVFSPQGDRILAGGGEDDPTVRLWDVATGKQLCCFEGHKGWVNVVFSPDGQWAASCGQDMTVRLWRLPAPPPSAPRSGEVRRFEGPTEMTNRVTISPDGKYVAGSSGGIVQDGRFVGEGEDYTIRLWEIATGREVRKLAGHTHIVVGVAFSADGKRLLSGGYDKTLRLWDVATGKELKRFEGHDEAVRNVALSPDGNYALSCGYDRTIRLWDVETTKEVRRFLEHTVSGETVDFSPDGRHVLFNGGDSSLLFLCETATGKEVCRCVGHTGGVWRARFSADGARVVSASNDGTVRLWDAHTGKELRSFSHRGQVHAVAFSPDGKRLLSGGEDTYLHLWDADTGKELHRFEGHEDRVCSLGITPDGRYAVSAGHDMTVRLWRLPEPTKLSAAQPPAPAVDPAPKLIEPESRLRWAGDSEWFHAELTPDDRYCLVVRGPNGREKVLRVWEVQSGKLIFERNVWIARLTPDSKHVLTCETFSELHVYEVATGKQVREFETGAQMFNIAPAATGTRLLYATPEGWQVWDWSDAKKLSDFPRSDGDRAVLSPDGRHLFRQEEGKPPLRVLDAATGKELESHRELREVPAIGSFSADGQQLLCSDDRILRVYNVQTGKEVKSFDPGLDGWNTYSGDFRRALATSKVRDELRLLDLHSGQLLGRLHFPELIDTPRICARLSRDGRIAIVSGPTDSVYVFRLPDAPAPKDQP